MKEKYLKSYMAVAEIFAEQSSAKRLHVGAIVVKDDRIISIGYNGMPSGWDNDCEDMIISQEEVSPGVFSLVKKVEFKSKPEVLHAETNAIAKLAKSTESGEGASIFITHAPCLECAKLIYQSGIKEVFYKNEYRSQDGVDFLKKCNIDIVKL